MKWCNGPCGRELDPAAFPPNRHGSPGGTCLVCKRYQQRESRRRRYRSSTSYRAHVKAVRRDWYHTHQAQETAARMRRWDRRKQRSAA